MDKKTLPVLLPVRSVIFPLIFIAGAAMTGKNVSDISNWWSTAAVIVNIFIIIMLTAIAKKRGQTYAQLINYQKGKTGLRSIVLVTLLILSVGMTGMTLAGLICYKVIPYAAPMIIAPIPKALAVINIPLLPVTTAFAEDSLYLGYGVNGFRNKTAAIMLPAFFFALQHSFIPTLFDVRYIIYRFISFLPLTVILCWYYHKKRDPLPIMIGHALIDVATVMQIAATSFIPGFYDKMCGM